MRRDEVAGRQVQQQGEVGRQQHGEQLEAMVAQQAWHRIGSLAWLERPLAEQRHMTDWLRRRGQIGPARFGLFSGAEPPGATADGAVRAFAPSRRLRGGGISGHSAPENAPKAPF
ncbi:hypothetical protein GCM10027514_03820 [Azotobacter armeniacus]